MSVGFALVLSLVSAPAVEVEAGVTYRGAQRLKVSAIGVSIRIASGWAAQLPPGAEAIVIQRPDRPGMILATADQTSRAKLMATMSAPIPVEPGVALLPQGAVKSQGNQLSARYSAGPFEGFAVATLSKDGRAVALVGIAPPAEMKRVRGAVQALAQSIRFGRVRAPAPAKSSGSPASALAGRKLHRFYGDYGYREHQIMVLCRNGRFYWNMEAGGFTPGVASGAANAQGHGVWSAHQNQLKLRWDDGSRRTYRVEERDGTLYLNGNKWLREAGGC